MVTAAPVTGGSAPPSTAGEIVRTARPKQWTKNLLVVAAPGAAGVLGHGDALARTVATFAIFTAAAAGSYFGNDVLDRMADRLHPVKRHRPVAAGRLSVTTALVTGAALMALAIGGSAFLGWRLTTVVGIYLAVQGAYAAGLKRMPVYDLSCVTAGFVLRGIAGAVAIPVRISEWFLIVTVFASLLMVTGKRVAEQGELGSRAGEHRLTLQLYSGAFLRTVLAISAAGAIVGYCLWAFALQTALVHHHDPIWYQLSIIPVLVGLLRYTFLVEAGRGARPEDLVLRDRSLVLLGAGWLTLFTLGVYAS